MILIRMNTPVALTTADHISKYHDTYGHSLVVHSKMAASERLTCREVIACSECTEIHEYMTTDL